MLYEYLIKNYIPGEPIFTGDIQIPGMTVSFEKICRQRNNMPI